MSVKESMIQRKCQKIIREYGGYCFKNNGNIYTEVGRPDLVACVNGKFVAIETKRKDHMNELSEAQSIVGKQIIKAGGIWIATDDPSIVEALMVKLVGNKNAL